MPAAATVRVEEICVRKLPLRIVVQVLHVRMGGRAVEVEVVFLDILAVVAFAVGQAEQPLLQNGVLAIPEGQRETESLMIVGNAGDTVLAPAIGARAGLVVAEIVPGVASLAVVLANRAPLAFAQIRPPFLPRSLALPGFPQPLLLSCHKNSPSRCGNARRSSYLSAAFIATASKS